MGVECRGRLLEVGRGGGEAGHELLDPTPIVEMDAQDLGGRHRGEMGNRIGVEALPVFGDQPTLIQNGADWFAIDEEAARLGHDLTVNDPGARARRDYYA
jgi:hypothetical protein